MKPLTTGRVARLFGVAPRTVAMWFDSGRLGGYRIPGSDDRRIPVEAALRFCSQFRLPVPPGLGPPVALAFALDPAETYPGAETYSDPVAFGAALGRHPCVSAVVAGDAQGLALARSSLRVARTLHPAAATYLVCPDDVADPDAPGGARVVRRPLDWAAIAAQSRPEPPRRRRHAAPERGTAA